MSASTRQADATRLVRGAGQIELAHGLEAPAAHEGRDPAGRARAANLHHTPQTSAGCVDRLEAQRTHSDRLWHLGHASGPSRTSTLEGASLLRAWGPVLAVLALCPLAAWLVPGDPAGPLDRAATLGNAEAWLGLRFEPAAVGWLTERRALHDAASLFYLWVHLPATLGVLVWVWLERRPAFRPARNAVVLTQVDAAAGAAIAGISLRVTA